MSTPLERPARSSVRPVLHAVTETRPCDASRSFRSSFSLARRRAAAGAGLSEHATCGADAGPTGRRACRRADDTQPVRLTDRVLHRRPRDRHRRRPGALSAPPGRPRQAALLGFRYSFAQPDGNYAFRARGDNVGWHDQGKLADYDRAGKLSVTRSYQIPQFYSVDTMTPYTGPAARWCSRCDAARSRTARPISTPTCRSRRSSAARAARHRPRRGGRDAEDELSLNASFRRRSTAAAAEAPASASATTSKCPSYESRANDFTIGTEWTNTKSMLRVAYTGSWFDNLADPLVWDSPPAWTTSPARPDAVALSPARRTPRRRSASAAPQAGAQDAGHRLLLLRPVEQQRAAAAVHHQFGAADDSAAARQRRSRGACLLDEPESDVAPHRRLAVQRALPQLHLRQSPATSITVTSPTIRAPRRPHRRPDLYAHDRTTFDGDATWSKLTPLALTVGYTHNGNGYDARSSSRAARIFRVSADAWGPPGLAGSIRGRQPQRIEASASRP